MWREETKLCERGEIEKQKGAKDRIVHGARGEVVTEVAAVLLHLLDVVLGQHGRRVSHGSPSFLPSPYDPTVVAAEERGGELGWRGWEEGKGTRGHGTRRHRRRHGRIFSCQNSRLPETPSLCLPVPGATAGSFIG